uniref:Uncharacterized protein n=1 Tax=Nothoprocta perdicaria TaxID=30464 RepID=A0A8C6YV64_NOTPE
GKRSREPPRRRERPKTFPATTYSGNSRQRLQEIREGLKQPSKSSSQGLPVGPGSETSLDTKILVGKDAARQQQMRQTPKFGPYQKALREIRYSLLPFANESGSTAAVEVNRQMLQELVNAGCDQVRVLLWVLLAVFTARCGCFLLCS